VSIVNKKDIMKKSILILAVSMVSLVARSQTIMIVNKSSATVYFRLSVSDKDGCNQKYTSITAVSAPTSTTKYQSLSEIQWSAEAPKSGAWISCFDGQYVDASGGCVSKASNLVGDAKCALKKDAVITASKCAPGIGDIHLKWASENGNVTVTIN
jgi:hypothetical protein